MIEKINLLEKVNSINALFQYLEIGHLNGHILNVLQAENRTLDFHVHDNSDELFYVIEGHFELEFEDGLIYTNENIEKLLMERYIGDKIRRSGGRTKGPSKRTKEDNARFEIAFEKLLKRFVL